MIVSKSEKLIISVAILSVVMSALFLNVAAADSKKEYKTGPPSGWITPVAVEEPIKIPSTAINDGIYYLLVDNQARKGATFKHYAQTIINKKGLESLSHISIDFDPSYEELVIHNIDVIRKGTVYNKLNPDRINLFQREEELEYQIYNGEKTFNIILDDLRVGDIVQYSYTISGENPSLKDMYYQSFVLQWSVPVYRLYHRLIWPSDRPVHMRSHGTDIKPSTSDHKGSQLFLVKRDSIQALIIDDNLPGWYYPYPWIEFSEASSWEEVARWGAPLYRVPSKLSGELDAKIKEIMSQEDKPEGRALSALRFIQDEIRYLGIEMGGSSYKPSDPSLVFSRRFGDCKDMALLFHTMLRKMGIESYPALVSTRYKDKVTESLPSPLAFNHVILRVDMIGKSYWLDPTQTYGRGNFDTMDQPRYGTALIISDDTRGLVPMNTMMTQGPLQEVKEIFHIRESNNEPSTYSVETFYRGRKANEIREDFATKSMQEIEKNYLNYYASSYPEIVMNNSISMKDDTTKNVIVVNESYLIPNFWTKKEEKGSQEGYFYPYELAEYTRRPSTKQRTMPLNIPYPAHFRQTTEINLPDDWYIEPSEVNIEDGSVDFKSRVDYRDRKLMLNYEFRTKKGHVDVSHVQEHISTKDRIYDELGYSIYNYGDGESEPNGVNWTILAVAGFSLILGAFLALNVYRYDPEHGDISLQSDTELKGLRGWLVVLAIGMCIQPVRLLVEFIQLMEVFELNTWISLTTPGAELYHPLLQLLLLFELIFNIFWIEFAVLMIVLFFQKRWSFPKIYIIYLLVIFSMMVIDLVVAEAIPTLNDDNLAETIKELFRQGVYTIIWSLYLIKSERVKNTFVKRRSKIEKLSAFSDNTVSP